MRKKLATVTAQLTVSSRWPKWSQPAVTEPWPGLWPSCDWAVIILKMPWLSCDLAVTSLWPSRDWAVTSPWPLLAVTEPLSLGPGAVTTVVTVSSRWPFIFSWEGFSTMLLTPGTGVHIFFSWRRHENMSPCTGSMLNTNYEWPEVFTCSVGDKLLLFRHLSDWLYINGLVQ